MVSTIDAYLNDLRAALTGSDAATVQDALSDAEEHLRLALEQAREAQPDVDEAAALPAIVAEYGSPDEVAAAYKLFEARVNPVLAPPRTAASGSPFARFFGIFADRRAWGGLLYMLFSLLTGILYFTWAVTGLSLSLGMMILIFGIPVTILFLLSVREVALIEGRLVEALLGMQMPRRAAFARKGDGIAARLKSLLTSRRTWLSILYMVVQLPLGVLYFSAATTLIALGLGLIAVTIVGPLFDLPVIVAGAARYYVQPWMIPLSLIAGVLTLTLTMHLAKWVGGMHSKFAKALLVKD